MAKYHVNAEGKAGLCRATTGKCPFGGELEHYSTADDARKAYEKFMSGAAGGTSWRPVTFGESTASGATIETALPGLQSFAMGEHNFKKAVFISVYPQSANGGYNGEPLKYVVVPHDGELSEAEKLAIAQEIWNLGGFSQDEWREASTMKKLQFAAIVRNTRKNVTVEVTPTIVKTSLGYAKEVDYHNIFLLPRESLGG